MTGLSRVLIANRGEIALRVVRACHDAGLAAIAVYAGPDAGAPFVRAADEAVALGGASAAETYLDASRLIDAATRTAADAVHPGYGFLSENAGFARAVAAAGLTWIGPPPEVIEALGDKVRAREIAARAGAPMVPGTSAPAAGPEEAAAFARRHGLPVAIKAAHGGGGRGLRVAREPGEVAELFRAAVREASAAFGRGECFVEAYVEGGRHVEAQVLADSHGTVRVVGTRDCTLQRRYQKLVEEAPAPFLTAAQRALLERSAAAICREAGYVSAGTVEFLLSPRGELSFLEVNTRLQVEHTVTEEASGLDLVGEQLRIAAGEPLGEPPPFPGRHAIEFRVNAEDPGRDFAPVTGTITRFRPPGGPGVRLDSGVEAGSVIDARYDSLLAKLVVTGRDRAQALARARRALAEFEVDGVPTTLPFLRAVVSEPAFTGTGPEGFAVHTRWIEQEYLPSVPDRAPDHAPGRREPDDRVVVPVGGRWLSVAVPGLAAAGHGPLARAREQARERRQRAAQVAGEAVTAPMQGTVTRVAAAEGGHVAAGDLIAVVEAMKMENPLRAPRDGQVRGLAVTAGQTVAHGAVICRVVSADGAAEPGAGVPPLPGAPG